jgi:hypothetical protein
LEHAFVYLAMSVEDKFEHQELVGRCGDIIDDRDRLLLSLGVVGGVKSGLNHLI